MEINSAFSSGVSGLNKASEQLTEASQNIAELNISSENSNSSNASKEEPVPVATISSYSAEPVTTDVINMKLAEVQAQAAAKVITTADDMVGSLINVSV
jgi:flagellar hook protein FlgE